MTHCRTVSARQSGLSVLIPLMLALFSLTACSSSSGSGIDAGSAGPSLPVTSGTTAASAAGSTAPAGSTSAPSGNDTKAVCARVIKIIQDSSRSAINALTPALQTGDQTKVKAAQTKAEGYYRSAATSLRQEAAKADDAKLGKEIDAAAAYFAKAAHLTSATSADSSLATLSQTCG
jgi:hypothetical protein